MTDYRAIRALEHARQCLGRARESAIDRARPGNATGIARLRDAGDHVSDALGRVQRAHDNRRADMKATNDRRLRRSEALTSIQRAYLTIRGAPPDAQALAEPCLPSLEEATKEIQDGL